MVVVQVMKIENDVDVIAFMVRRLTGVHKYVFLFSTEGLEDVSKLAVAKAFSTGMESHPQLLDAVIEIVGAENVRESHLKMADHPFGSELIGQVSHSAQANKSASHGTNDLDQMLKDWPVVKKNNLFFLSWRHARPDRLARCLNALRPYIKKEGSSPVFVTTLKVLMPNAELVGQIALVDIRHADGDTKVLSFSSYEVVEQEGAPAVEREITCVRISSTSWSEMQDVVEEFLAAVPVELVLSIQDNRTHGHMDELSAKSRGEYIHTSSDEMRGALQI